MITCDLCNATTPNVTTAIESDWEPCYCEFGDYEGSEPICPACIVAKCHVTDEGLTELICDNPHQIINARRSDSIRGTITDYMHGKSEPSRHDLLCFVGMLESGEATVHDFAFVGGIELAAKVAAIGFTTDHLSIADRTASIDKSTESHMTGRARKSNARSN